jgi:hypothetical protein
MELVSLSLHSIPGIKTTQCKPLTYIAIYRKRFITRLCHATRITEEQPPFRIFPRNKGITVPINTKVTWNGLGPSNVHSVCYGKFNTIVICVTESSCFKETRNLSSRSALDLFNDTLSSDQASRLGNRDLNACRNRYLFLDHPRVHYTSVSFYEASYPATCLVLSILVSRYISASFSAASYPVRYTSVSFYPDSCPFTYLSRSLQPRIPRHLIPSTQPRVLLYVCLVLTSLVSRPLHVCLVPVRLVSCYTSVSFYPASCPLTRLSHSTQPCVLLHVCLVLTSLVSRPLHDCLVPVSLVSCYTSVSFCPASCPVTHLSRST